MIVTYPHFFVITGQMNLEFLDFQDFQDGKKASDRFSKKVEIPYDVLSASSMLCGSWREVSLGKEGGRLDNTICLNTVSFSVEPTVRMWDHNVSNGIYEING